MKHHFLQLRRAPLMSLLFLSFAFLLFFSGISNRISSAHAKSFPIGKGSMDGVHRVVQFFFLPGDTSILGGTGSYDDIKKLHIWRTRDGLIQHELEIDPKFAIYRIALSHDGTKCAVQYGEPGEPMVLEIISLPDFKSICHVNKLEHDDNFTFSGNDSTLFVAHGTDLFRVSTIDGNVVDLKEPIMREYPIKRAFMRGVVFDYAGTQMLLWDQRIHSEFLRVGDSSPKIKVIDLLHGGELATITKPTGISSATFSGDGHEVFLSCYDDSIRVWSLQNNAIVKTFYGKGLYLTCSRDGKYLAASNTSKCIIWEIRSWNVVRELSPGLTGFIGHPLPIQFSFAGDKFVREAAAKISMYEIEPWRELWTRYSCPDDSVRDN